MDIKRKIINYIKENDFLIYNESWTEQFDKKEFKNALDSLYKNRIIKLRDCDGFAFELDKRSKKNN